MKLKKKTPLSFNYFKQVIITLYFSKTKIKFKIQKHVLLPKDFAILLQPFLLALQDSLYRVKTNVIVTNFIRNYSLI